MYLFETGSLHLEIYVSLTNVFLQPVSLFLFISE